MKIASRILGALVIVMLVVVTVMTFVQASAVVKNPASSAADSSGDIVGFVEGSVGAAMALLGYLGYILVNALGAAMILYLICFCVSYGKLYKNKSNSSFIRYSAITCGVILFFVVLVFACNPLATWKVFTVALITAALMIAYAAVAIKYLDDIDKYDKSPERYDAPPVFTFGDEEEQTVGGKGRKQK